MVCTGAGEEAGRVVWGGGTGVVSLALIGVRATGVVSRSTTGVDTVGSATGAGSSALGDSSFNGSSTLALFARDLDLDRPTVREVRLVFGSGSGSGSAGVSGAGEDSA